MIAILSCGARKLNEPATALDLYTGPYFSACLSYALTQVPQHRIFVLSALHGLVPGFQVLKPYNFKLGGSVDALRALRFKADPQVAQLGLRGADVLALCSGNYLYVLHQIFEGRGTITAPIAGLQVGMALSHLKKLTLAARAELQEELAHG